MGLCRTVGTPSLTNTDNTNNNNNNKAYPWAVPAAIQNLRVGACRDCHKKEALFVSVLFSNKNCKKVVKTVKKFGKNLDEFQKTFWKK